jgi:diguanylate cyclase (GGDEF)-like protein
MKFKTFSRWPLKLQMAWVFTVLLVGVTSVLSLAWLSLMVPRIERSAATSLQIVAGNAARVFSDGLHERSRQIELLANTEVMWSGGLDTGDVRRVLELSQVSTPDHKWIGVASMDGIVRSATGGLLVGQDVASRPWFPGGSKGTYVGDVHPAKLLATLLPPLASGEPIRFVDFAAPVHVDGHKVGVLTAHGSWDWARQVIEALLPPNAKELGLAAFLFDRNGDMIYAPDGQTERYASEGQRLPDLKTGKQIRLEGDILAAVVPWKDGQEYLTAVVRLPARSAVSDLGWYVVTSIPVTVAFAEVRSAALWVLGLGVVGCFLAAWLAWLAAGRLSEHLSAISSAAYEVAHGRPGAQIPVLHSSSDVHRLSSSLQNMTERLQHVNEQTERLVQERTRALEAATRELANLASTDPLTGLLNRRGFEPQWQQGLAFAQRAGHPISALMVDIDHFKRVNDTYGHAAGDDVIRYLSRLLRERLRATDVVSRFGGEEFAAMLPDTDADSALHVAQVLVEAMAAQPLPVVGLVTISVGVSTRLPGKAEEEGAADLLEQADAALYSAKRTGRNRAVAWPPALTESGGAESPSV